MGNKNKKNMSELSDQIIAIISDKLNVPNEEVTLEKTLKDLGSDSLDTVELVMELEDKFFIKIPDAEMEKILTVGDVIDYIENKKK